MVAPQAVWSAIGLALLIVNGIIGFVLAKFFSMKNSRKEYKIAYICLLATFQAFLYSNSAVQFFLGIFFTVLGYRFLVPGLTGGLGTGKSTVAAYLKSHGWMVIDADEISRDILKRGSPAFYRVVNAFGSSIIDKRSGEVDRNFLRHVVFNDPTKRRLLNRLTHPWIIATILWRIFKYRICLWRRRVLVDIPLLFETGLNLVCGPVAVVYVSQDLQLRRLVSRDRASSAELLNSMIKSQLPLKEKVSLADIALDNNSTLENLYEQVKWHFPC